MRAASVQLQARLNGESTSLARLWRVTRRDGQVLRFTDSVRPVTIQIAPDATPQVYRSDVSFTASAIFTSRSMANQQSVTITFIMDPGGFAETDIRARAYDGAKSEVYVVDYNFPQYGTVSMYQGTFGMITLSDQRVCTVEVIPMDSSLNGIGLATEKYQQTCRANLGDARCKVDLSTLKLHFTVASAIGGSFVSNDLVQENAHWALGFVQWATGQNANTTSQVGSSDLGTRSAFLLTPPFYPIQAGDTGFIFPGCDKLRKTCIDKFNNVLNMRAEPDVPTGAGVPGTNYNLSGYTPYAP